MSQKRQKKLYSGKKKSHTRKNVILSDERNRILVLTKTKSGRRHDKRLADKENLFQNLPAEVTALVDTGFEGIQHYHPKTLIPEKRLESQNIIHPHTINQRAERVKQTHFFVQGTGRTCYSARKTK